MRARAASVQAQLEAILCAWGMPADLAAETSQVMTDTDLAGIDSHGVGLVPTYDAMRRAGQLRLDARPRVLRDGVATALVDGGAGLGHPPAAFAMRLAIAKARQAGIGAVGVVNSHHFGAAGWYAALAAEAGCLGLVTSGTRTLAMVPPRGAMPVLGTNPIAFAAPAGEEAPMLLDIATTAAAANKVRAHAMRGKPIPEGWVVDADGAPVTEGEAAVAQVFAKAEGGLSPLGGAAAGHKGYGLGLMAHVLAGTLTGGSFSPIRLRTQAKDEPDNIGHFMLAIDPGAFRPAGDFAADMDAALGVLRATPAADPGQPVLIPGDPERAARAERLAQGIPMPEALVAQVRAVAEAAGAPFLLVAAA